MQKILVLGSRGQLGRDMTDMATAAGNNVVGLDFPEIDITDPNAVNKIVVFHAPQAIINCCAYTAVDACESHAREAFAVNSDGIAAIAEAARKTGALVVHFSTDYVYDGLKTLQTQKVFMANQS